MADDTTEERYLCAALTRAGNPCRNLPQRNSVFCSTHRPPVVPCPALTLQGEPCKNNALDFEEFCAAHNNARDEGWNWWEWADEEAAEETRLRLAHEVRGIVAQRANAARDRAIPFPEGTRRPGQNDDLSDQVVAIDPSPITAQPEAPRRRTPWWRRWWMIIIWIIIAIGVINAIGQAL